MIISTSGGLVYHARALRARLAQDAWKDARTLASFCALQWLKQTAPQSLYLIGPSSGYLMTQELILAISEFAKHKPLIIFEPDPIARIALRRRLTLSQTQNLIFKTEFEPRWIRSDPDEIRFHGYQDTSTSTSDRSSESSSERQPAFLFWGCLGQLTRLRELEQRLGPNRSEPHLIWASLHDRYSIEGRSHEQNKARWAERPLRQTIIDHETSWISKCSGSLPIPIRWPLTQSRLHWLEWVTSNPVDRMSS